jgi:hypothetical protein
MKVTVTFEGLIGKSFSGASEQFRIFIILHSVVRLGMASDKRLSLNLWEGRSRFLQSGLANVGVMSAHLFAVVANKFLDNGLRYAGVLE